ncbi:HK97 family phage prohead protease [Companilactobacillus mishanensis]|uniref:HK97 family phage prohead protease n=1 Tax=Companilactobacillus mishanensis TaxID=2486008 RepID=A0A5P0ZGP9_9LACO|nr:HK97 family phage prohead protease [Companilactobacillus mishanensis]
MTVKQEVRSTPTTVEFRNDEDTNTNVIEGYALKFNKRSNPLGFNTTFVETLNQRCLNDTDMSNVVATFNHDQSQVLGRTGVNLDLNVDDVGLRFKVTLPDTTLAHDVLENIRAGIITQCSFAFDMPDDDSADSWTRSNEDGVDYERTINNIAHLYDVSVVTTPAYSDTNVVVGARSLERAKEMEEIPLIKKRNDILRELKIQEIKEVVSK